MINIFNVKPDREKNSRPFSEKHLSGIEKSSRMLSKKITDALRKAPSHTYGYEHRSQTHIIKATRCFAP
jgi:hypothetical protein